MSKMKNHTILTIYLRNQWIFTPGGRIQNTEEMELLPQKYGCNFYYFSMNRRVFQATVEISSMCKVPWTVRTNVHVMT